MITLAARAVLLAERLDHRGLERLGPGIANPMPLAASPDGLPAFAFRWGAVATFGASAEQARELVASLRYRLDDPLDEPTGEAATLRAGAAEDGLDGSGVVLLRDLSVPRLAVVAEALAKSAALSHQEATVARTFGRLDPMVDRLRRRGRLGVSSRPILRTIGEALAARGRAATKVETGDKPEMLWEHPELGPLYARLSEELELAERCAALDRKLDLARGASEALLSLVEARRSRALELSVALLVGVEAASTLYNLFRG